MSTHHSRNQQRRQQSGTSALPVQNTPTAPPKTFAKGIVIPLVINLFLCVALCIGKILINKHTSIHLPARTIPLLILASLLIAVFIVVSYVIKQYKYLQGTYQNLEQGMAAAAMLNAQQGDFVEYPVNSTYYGNNLMYNQYNQIPQNMPAPVPTANSRPNNPRKKIGCSISLMTILLVTVVMGLFAYMSIPQNMDITKCKLTAGTVTEVNKYVYEDDEDTYTEYMINYKYSYGGEEYTGKDTIKFSAEVNDDIDVIIDSANPQNSFLAANVTYMLLVWGGSIILLAIVGLIIGARH